MHANKQLDMGEYLYVNLKQIQIQISFKNKTLSHWWKHEQDKTNLLKVSPAVLPQCEVNF